MTNWSTEQSVTTIACLFERLKMKYDLDDENVPPYLKTLKTFFEKIIVKQAYSYGYNKRI